MLDFEHRHMAITAAGWKGKFRNGLLSGNFESFNPMLGLPSKPTNIWEENDLK